MAKKLTEFLLEGAGDEIKAIDRSTLVAMIVEEHGVEPYTHDENTPTVQPKQIVESLLTKAEAGAGNPDETPQYQEVYDALEEIVTFTANKLEAEKESKEKEAAEKKAAKEAEKKAKEEAKAAIVARREAFLAKAQEGASHAQEDFIQDLQNLKDGLGDGIKINVNEDGTFGATFDEGVTEVALASGIGYLLSRQESSTFLNNSLQFIIGDVALKAVETKLFPSMIQCGKALSSQLATVGITLHGRNVENYSRMAARVPMELRNAKVDPTAYLEVARAGAPQIPRKKEDNETDESFKKRVAEANAKKDAFEADRGEVIKLLKQGYYETEVEIEDDNGEITTEKKKVELKSKSDVAPLLEEVQVKHGLKEVKDPNKKTASDYANAYFHADFALEYLLGIHEKDTVVYAAVDGKGTVSVTKQQLMDTKEEAKNNLINMKYDRLDEILKGVEIKEVTVMEDGEDGKSRPKKDKDGNVVKKSQEFKFFPAYKF